MMINPVVGSHNPRWYMASQYPKQATKASMESCFPSLLVAAIVLSLLTELFLLLSSMLVCKPSRLCWGWAGKSVYWPRFFATGPYWNLSRATRIILISCTMACLGISLGGLLPSWLKRVVIIPSPERSYTSSPRSISVPEGHGSPASHSNSEFEDRVRVWNSRPSFSRPLVSH